MPNDETGSNDLLQELAVQSALKISNNKPEIAVEFISTTNEVLVSVTIAKLISDGDEKIFRDFLKPYLRVLESLCK